MKKIFVRKTNYQLLFEEKENLKRKYHKKLISKKEYLKSMGHKIRKLDKEAMRSKPAFIDKEVEEPAIRMRFVRSEEDRSQLRVQEISEHLVNGHEHDQSVDASRVQNDHPYVNRVVGVRAKTCSAPQDDVDKES